MNNFNIHAILGKKIKAYLKNGIEIEGFLEGYDNILNLNLSSCIFKQDKTKSNTQSMVVKGIQISYVETVDSS